MSTKHSATWDRADGSRYKPKKRMTQREYADREDDEWDLRVDVHDVFTPDKLITNMSARLSMISYAMISGVELPDGPKLRRENPFNTGGQAEDVTSASEHLHVHICLKLEETMCRSDAIRIVLNMEPSEVPKGQLYCRPRYKNWSYGGWISHHCKNLTKVDTTDTNCIWQYGLVPREDLTEIPAKQLDNWCRTINKYAIPHWRVVFQHYFDAAQDLFDESTDGFIGPKRDHRKVKIIPQEELANLPPH